MPIPAYLVMYGTGIEDRSIIVSLTDGRGDQMSVRVRITICFFLVLLVVPLAPAKNKKKQELPDYVLKAETVAVVIRPYAGEPVTNPTSNRTAEDNMERALLQWGRIQACDRCHGRRLGNCGSKGTSRRPNNHRFANRQPWKSW